MSTPPTDSTRWFIEEVQPHEQPLRSYLRRSLPSLADVDDLLQDTYMRVLRAKNNGTINSTKPFLFAIARNAVRDFLHRNAKADVIPMAEDVSLPVLHEQLGLVESLCRQQEVALLAEAIEALPPRCREVVLLRKIKGLSQRQIAELLGISENTVEGLAVKGARRCAEYLRARGLGGSSHDASA